MFNNHAMYLQRSFAFRSPLLSSTSEVSVVALTKEMHKMPQITNCCRIFIMPLWIQSEKLWWLIGKRCWAMTVLIRYTKHKKDGYRKCNETQCLQSTIFTSSNVQKQMQCMKSQLTLWSQHSSKHLFCIWVQIGCHHFICSSEQE